MRMNRSTQTVLIILGLLATSCQQPLIRTSPGQVKDTGAVTIICNAAMGNKGLLDYEGPVYVHMGLITDSSTFPNDWRYVKFKWGNTDEAALAKKVKENQWSYTIPGVRNFFAVPANEQIKEIVILFRNANCVDTFCQVLRNEDRSDIHIPVNSLRQ